MADNQEKQIVRPLRGCGGVFFLFMLLLGAGWGAALGFFVSYLEDARSTITTLEEFRPKVGSKVYSWDGEMLGEFTIEQRQLVRLSDIPLHLQKAFIATEDDIFYDHKGVRIDAIVNAALDVLRKQRFRGASTITMQVVRNVEPLDVGTERTMNRKLREAITALQVERKFTKDEILELYLNQIFLGISAYGVESASQQYFDKSCGQVTLGEAAMLAGLTRAPNRQEPFRNPENALSRRNTVLAQMHENNFITQEEYQAALAEDLTASIVTPEERAQRRAEGREGWAPNKFKAPYFTEEVRRFLLEQLDKQEVFEEGLEVYTTIDMNLQRAAEQTLTQGLKEFDETKLEQLKRLGQEDEFVPVAGALICLDNRAPYQGFVRAIVGGRDWEKEKYNTATQARRQPGSSIKPFVWAAAIASGMTPSNRVVDEPIVRVDGAGNVWRPGNFDGKYRGSMTLRRALESSVNIASIKLTEQVGMPMVRSYLQSAGITTPIDDVVGLTIALGTPDITVLDQAVAYSTFANNGMRYDPVMVTEIRNRDGLTRYDYRAYQKSEQAMDPAVAFVVNYMMQGVAQWGTGARSRDLDRPRAGKTGTTNEARNVWFCGFTPDYTCVIWVGYRDNRSLGRGANYTGGRIACPIWTKFMVKAHEGLPPRDFVAPEGVEFINVDRHSGYPGGSFREAFVKGTGPPKAAPPPPRPAAAAPSEAAPPEPEPAQLLEPII